MTFQKVNLKIIYSLGSRGESARCYDEKNRSGPTMYPSMTKTSKEKETHKLCALLLTVRFEI